MTYIVLSSTLFVGSLKSLGLSDIALVLFDFFDKFRFEFFLQGNWIEIIMNKSEETRILTISDLNDSAFPKLCQM